MLSMPISFSFVFIRLVVLVFHSVYALFRHRRGRKTETSSDASQEAPERARKDTSEEAKLHEGSILSLARLHKRSSQAFLRRYPKRGGGYGCSPPARAGNLFCHQGTQFLENCSVLYQKIRPADGKTFGLPVRRPARALSAGCLPIGTLIYEQCQRI